MVARIEIQTNTADLIRRMDGFSADLEEVRLSGSRTFAFRYRDRVIANTRASGIPMRLRNVKWAGPQGNTPLVVAVVKQPSGDYTVQGSGPWQFVEGPVKAHSLRPRRAQGRKNLRTPQGFRQSTTRNFRHPGLRGKRIWRRTYAQMRDEGLAIYRQGVERAMRRRFPG